MSVVRIFGNLWDHTGAPLPVELAPELWFRPNGTYVADGAILRPVEVKANLDLITGYFTADVVAAEGITYTPSLSWRSEVTAATPELQARRWAEWNFRINPFPDGGLIDELAGTDLSVYTVLVSLDPPPPNYRGWYLNAGPGDPDDPSQSGTGILEIVS